MDAPRPPDAAEPPPPPESGPVDDDGAVDPNGDHNMEVADGEDANMLALTDANTSVEEDAFFT